MNSSPTRQIGITVHQEEIIGEPAIPTPTPTPVPKSNNRWNIELTKTEKDLLARIVWLESGNQTDLGIQAVIEIIFNRMGSSLFPDSLQGVLSQKTQFSTWKNRNIAVPTEKVYRNIDKVLDGQTNIFSSTYYYFRTKRPHTNDDPVKIGAHYFSKQPK